MKNNGQKEFSERVRVNQQKLSSDFRTRFDYIVCGAGTSGSVVAARLASDPNTQVLLLEAGGTDETDLITNPNNWPKAMGRMMESGGGCALVDETVRDGRRHSIYRSYLYPFMAQSNITVLTGALLTRLRFNRRSATGVEFQYQGRIVRAEATREVILSLGAIHTPKLLMQSGIGDESELRRVGIPVLQPLPGVGRNLHDHVAFGCLWENTDPSLPPLPRGQVGCFWKTAVALDAPNFYAYGSPVPAITPQNATRFKLPASCWSLFVGMRPNSRGTIHLTGPDPDDQLSIDANYLGDPHDIKDLITGLTVAREIGDSAALRPFRGREVAPGTLDAAQLEQFFRDGLVTFWHQCGTANMGRDETSVVDGQLRVYGVDNLRIADGSILPRVTTGNTMAPCVVIGEQAAALLQRVPRSQIGTSRESIARGISLPLPEKARLHMSFLIKERNRQEQQGKGTLDDNTKHRYQIICSGCPTGAHAP